MVSPTEDRTTPGRPRRLYRAATDGVVATDASGHRLLAEMLASHLTAPAQTSPGTPSPRDERGALIQGALETLGAPLEARDLVPFVGAIAMRRHVTATATDPAAADTRRRPSREAGADVDQRRW